MKNAWQLEPFYFAPTPKPGGGWIAHKDSPDPPPPPDYVGAARETANSQKYNQYTPLGNMTWTQAPGERYQTGDILGTPLYGMKEGQWSSHINLNPQVQSALDAQLQSSSDVGQLQHQQVGQVANRSPFDLGSVKDIADQSYAAQTSRLDPQWQHASEMQDAQLANQGIMQGSQAYDNAQRVFGQQKNDAYTQARLAAIQTEPQTFQLAHAAYEQPLNELNAIRSASQVQMPQFGGPLGAAPYGQAAAAQGQYGQGLYNAQMGAENANTAGLYGLGGAALGAYGMYSGLAAMSDRRLKSNIVKVCEDQRGFGIYEFDIAGHRARGVMADEVEKIIPAAVVLLPSGFKAVDYGML